MPRPASADSGLTQQIETFAATGDSGRLGLRSTTFVGLKSVNAFQTAARLDMVPLYFDSGMSAQPFVQKLGVMLGYNFVFGAYTNVVPLVGVNVDFDDGLGMAKGSVRFALQFNADIIGLRGGIDLSGKKKPDEWIDAQAIIKLFRWDNYGGGGGWFRSMAIADESSHVALTVGVDARRQPTFEDPNHRNTNATVGLEFQIVF